MTSTESEYFSFDSTAAYTIREADTKKSIYHELSGEATNHSDAPGFTIQYQDGCSGLEVVIYSPQLIDLLKKACTNYPGSEYQALFKPRVCFKDPFMILFYNMDTILEMKDFVEEEGLRDTVDRLLKLKRMSFYPATVNQTSGSSDAISFDDLWLLYRPGTTVYRLPSELDESWSAYKIGNSSYRNLSEGDEREFRVIYYSLHFDKSGKKLIPFLHELVLGSYVGERFTAHLDLVPEDLMQKDQLQSVKESLEQRGQKYWSFNGSATYQYYFGSAWSARQQPEELNVIIDCSTANGIISDDLAENDRKLLQSDGCICSACCLKYAALPAYPPGIVENHTTCPRDRYPGIKPSFARGRDGCPPNPFMFCPSHIEAYALHHKSSTSVKISALSNPQKSTDLLDSLVLTERAKFLLDTRIEKVMDAQSNPQSDIALSGLIIVLQGSPGTGKTMTTRAISEANGRPLYVLSWPDMIARSFADFEQHMVNFLSNAKNWSAFLIIDHADSLLLPPDNKAELYSSFVLSKLEHYRGILFLLTSNGNGEISKLMAARTNILIQMHPLNPDARARVWTQLAEDVDDSKDRKALIDLAPQMSAHALNGHQIRNCLHNAIALSKRGDVPLQKKHLEAALNYDAEFTANGIPGQLFELAKRAIGTSYSRRAGSAPSSPKFARPASLSRTNSGKIVHIEEQTTAYPFPITPVAVAAAAPVVASSPSVTVPSLDTPSIAITVPSSPRLFPLAAAATIDANTLSPPGLQRPARPAARLSRPSMLRRHTTQGSGDRQAGDAEPEAAWTWKMLPARVRRPQLQFERGLSNGSEDERLSEREDGRGGKGR